MVEPNLDTGEELRASTYEASVRGNASNFEPRERIMARLDRSPDRADALALAAARHVGKIRQRGVLPVHCVQGRTIATY